MFLKNMSSTTRYNTTIWLAAWTALHLLQAGLTPLTPDEAYYRMYAAHPALGYFDHPPLVAWFIALGQFVAGDNALGVRLAFVVAQTLALWIVLQRLLPERERGVIGLPLWITIIMLHVYGWVATPDGPLLLMAALYCWAYRRFCDQENARHAVLLGLAMAAMLWAKYHGVLIILLTIISHPRLALRPWAWMAVAVGLLVFAPHLWWQWANEWPTLRYHLGERSPEDYVPRHSLEFVLNHLLLYNPFVFIPVMWWAARQRLTDPLERVLRLVLWGFPVFFLLMTLKVYSEPHWTYVIVLPLIYFLPQVIRSQRYVLRVLFGLTPLLLLARVFIMVPGPHLPPDFWAFHQKAKAMVMAAEGRPLLIGNSYQLAALADWYAEQPVMALYLADRKTRHNQYTIFNEGEWPLQGQPAYVAANMEFGDAQRVPVPGLPGREVWGKPVEHLQFLKKFDIRIEGIGKDRHLRADQSLSLRLFNPYDRPVSIDSTGEWRLGVFYYNAGYMTALDTLRLPALRIGPGEVRQVNIGLLAQPPAWRDTPDAELMFSLMGREKPHSVNSPFYIVNPVNFDPLLKK